MFATNLGPCPFVVGIFQIASALSLSLNENPLNVLAVVNISSNPPIVLISIAIAGSAFTLASLLPTTTR